MGWLGALARRFAFRASVLHRRMLPVYFAWLGPRASYAVTGALARVLYRLLLPVRVRSEAQTRASLAGSVGAARALAIAESAFVHSVWNRVDLYLAPRFIHPGTFKRLGGSVPEPHLSDMLDAQRRRQPALLISAYYGPIDLLPCFLGYSGIRAAVVYRPHAAADFDQFRRRVRARGGNELIAVKDATRRIPEVLAEGGSVALVADHEAAQRGLSMTFLGLPTLVPKTVGLLAQQFNADVVVAGIRRVGPLRFQVHVEDVFKPPAWRAAEDPLREITQRYLRALERMILRDPAQYLWVGSRWGDRAAAQIAAAEPS